MPAIGHTHTVTKLSNGIDLIIESPQVPNYISIVIDYDFGVQDETSEGSGYLQWLHNCITNYLLMEGKDLHNIGMDFNKESFTIRVICMAYQVDEILGTVFNALRSESLHREVLDSMEYDKEQDNDIKQLIEQAAFGLVGKGKPQGGMSSSYENKDSWYKEAMRLHKENMRPENILIAASGVYNNSEFIKIVEKNSKLIESPDGSAASVISKRSQPRRSDPFIAGRVIKSRIKPEKAIHFDENDMSAEQIAFAFPTNGITHADFFTWSIIESVIGESSFFSSGGPGKGMHAMAVKMLHDCHPATHIQTLKQSYISHGLFGLIFKGTKGSSKTLFEHLVLNFRTLDKKITNESLERARNILKSKIVMNLEGQQTRIDEMASLYKSHSGKVQLDDYMKNLDAVTYNQVIELLRTTLKEKTAVAAIGNFDFLENESSIRI
jgi:processing peptidase subunit alpha